MEKRDAKEDPRPGDRVRKKTAIRQVVERKGGEIRYFLEGEDASPLWHYCWITTWKRWCRDAEVLS